MLFGGVPPREPRLVHGRVSRNHSAAAFFGRRIDEDGQSHQVLKLRTGRVRAVEDDDARRLAGLHGRQQASTLVPVIRVPHCRLATQQWFEGLGPEALPVHTLVGVRGRRSSVPLGRCPAGVEVVAVDDCCGQLFGHRGSERRLSRTTAAIERDQERVAAASYPLLDRGHDGIGGACA